MNKRKLLYFIGLHICLTFCILITSASAGEIVFGTDKDIAPYPYYASHVSSIANGGHNNMMVLNSGVAALQKRIDMIRSAKKEIILEYFIYELGDSGKLLFEEMMKRAKEGVRVRILLDRSITVIEADPYYADYLKKNSGIEMAYHRRALDPVAMQFRTHRKIFGIDGKEIITGGRNIGDDYFDLSPTYNFWDRDIWVSGPIVRAAWDSFETSWNEKSIVKIAEQVKPRNASRLHRGGGRNRDRRAMLNERIHKKRLKEVKDWFADNAHIDALAKRVEKSARPILNNSKVRLCPKATYVSDRAGKTYGSAAMTNFSKNYKHTRKELFRRFEKDSNNEIILSSPYFILNKPWKKLLKSMLEAGKSVTLYTNSLGSTDAFYVAANFYAIVFKWVKLGLKAYIHDSKYYANGTTLARDSVAKARWGVHSKTFIFSDDSFYVGTYNIDNRSDFYNMEMGIICDGSKDLRDDVANNIKLRMEESYEITGRGKALNRKGEQADIYGNATKKAIKTMKSFSLPSQWLKFLL